MWRAKLYEGDWVSISHTGSGLMRGGRSQAARSVSLLALGYRLAAAPMPG
ncbi:MAG TPA: hypothetical protein VKB96_17865 [Gammaproteobacteria bacterium]|nr:hypothetical protein [Gammaproteobacteria bacterium]